MSIANAIMIGAGIIAVAIIWASFPMSHVDDMRGEHDDN